MTYTYTPSTGVQVSYEPRTHPDIAPAFAVVFALLCVSIMCGKRSRR